MAKQDQDVALTKTRLRDGVWEGVVHGAGTEQPVLTVTHLDSPLDGVEVSEIAKGEWQLRVPIPVNAISDGVQTFLVQHSQSGETLTSFAISAGAALSEDLRAEVNLLRAELDMLKRAFRRHCVETGA